MRQRPLRGNPVKAASQGLHGLTLFLTLIATAMFQAAQREPGDANWTVASGLLVQWVLTLAGAAYCRRAADSCLESRLLTPIFLAMIVGTYLWEPLGRWLFDVGRPFEILVMHSLRHLALALAAAACWPDCRNMAGLLSLFLVVFSATLATTPVVQILCGIYVLVAVWWLAAAHWERLRGCLLPGAGDRSARRRIAWIGVFLLALVALAMPRGLPGLSMMSGWAPSSGGGGVHDPYSRNGVGDGDNFVAGMEQIQSFAPIEEAPFRSSDEPSLYDLFNELYEEPVINKRVERAIALPPELGLAVEQQLSRSEQAGQQFSTLRRRGATTARPVGDRTSDALLYVAGRVPLHLRLELFDVFDGVNWHPEPLPPSQRPLEMIRVAGRPWVQLPPPARSLSTVSVRESHALKVVHLHTNRIPSPAQLTGLHIDQVDRLDLFQWGQEGIVQMDRERLPSLTPLHLTSLTLDLQAVAREYALTGVATRRHQALPPVEGMDAVRRLALQWTSGVARGWPQVEAISRRLRADCALDREKTAPEDGTSPVAHFLTVSRRGPDYQFATAAALLLRSLGYSTRVVGGFYVDPRRYDFDKRQTPVLKDDVHLWAEVYLASGLWATVEVTPGYEVLGPPPGLLDRLLSGLAAMARWGLAHALPIVGIGCAVLLTILKRFALADRVLVLTWRWASRGDVRRTILGALRILERRRCWSGHSSPTGQTPQVWLTGWEAECGNRCVALRQYLSLVDWAAFAPAHVSAPGADAPASIRDCCEAMLLSVPLTAAKRQDGVSKP